MEESEEFEDYSDIRFCEYTAKDLKGNTIDRLFFCDMFLKSRGFGRQIEYVREDETYYDLYLRQGHNIVLYKSNKYSDASISILSTDIDFVMNIIREYIDARFEEIYQGETKDA